MLTLCLDVVLVRYIEQNYVGVKCFFAGHSALEGTLTPQHKRYSNAGVPCKWHCVSMLAKASKSTHVSKQTILSNQINMFTFGWLANVYCPVRVGNVAFLPLVPEADVSVNVFDMFTKYDRQQKSAES